MAPSQRNRTATYSRSTPRTSTAAPVGQDDPGNVAAAQIAILAQARKCAAGDMDDFKHSGVIYGYIRVSSVEQSRFSHGHVSLEAQRGAIQAFVEQKWPRALDIRWVEEVKSARTMDKQVQLRKILRDIPRSSIVVTYDVSRFSRNSRDGLNYLHSLYKKDCQLWSAAEGVQYYGTIGKNIFTLTLAVAEGEGNRISDRVKQSLAYCRARGDFLGREAPYGQEAVRLNNGRRVLRPNRAEERLMTTYNRLWRDFQGTYAAFATHLNELGYSYRGKRWSGHRITGVLEGYNLRMRDVAAALPAARSVRPAAPVVVPVVNPRRTLRSLRSQARAILNEARDEMELDPVVAEESDNDDSAVPVAPARAISPVVIDSESDSDSDEEEQPLLPIRNGLRRRVQRVAALPRATGAFRGRR